MDTSKEYIRMCEKAEEIKETRIPSNDDILLHNICPKCMLETEVHPNPMYMHICEHCKWSGNYNDLLFIWLPRQDQLQDILEYSVVDLVYDFYEFCHGLDIFYDDKGKGEFNNFKSMEQLWLAFVMYEKYVKYWDGEKWESDFSKINNI